MNCHRILLALISGLILMSAALSLASEHYDVLIERGVEAKMRMASCSEQTSTGPRPTGSSQFCSSGRHTTSVAAWILAFALPRKDTL